MVAAIRPDSWNFPLLVHVFGASVLVGALVLAVAALVLAWRRQAVGDASAFGRVAFRALLFVAFPAWWVMRIGAQWIYSREGFGDAESEPAWLGIGFVTSEAGGILLLVGIILAGIGARRLARGAETSIPLRIATILVALVLLAYLVAVWAMTAKPD